MWTKALFLCGCLSFSLATPADPASYLLPPPLGQLAKEFQPSTAPPPASKEPEPTISLEPPFYQRVAQWFGIGGRDEPEPFPSIEFQQRHAEASQVEPAVKPKKSQCNPCNKIPWTPMISGQRSLSNLGAEVNSFNAGYPVYSSYRSIPQPRPDTIVQNKYKYSENRTKQAIGFNSFSHQATKDEYPNYSAVRAPPPQYQPVRSQLYQPVYQHYPNYNFFKTFENSHGQRIALPTYKPKLAYPTPSSYSSGPGITSPDYQPPQSLLPLQYSPKHHLLPIPLPNLSMVPLPPLFGAKPFRAINSYGQIDQNPYSSNQYQPHIDYSYTSVQPHTTPSPTPDDVIIVARTPTTAYPPIASDVEIIPSISLGEFTSSVKYPIDQPNASPFVDVHHQSSGGYSQPDYLASPIIVDQVYNPNDNYHAASSSNASFEQPEFDRDGSIKSIQSQLINNRPSSPITILPDLFSSETTIEPQYESSSPRPLSNVDWSHKKERGTPKNLLDSPIYYMNKSLQRTTKSPDNLASRLPDMDNTPWTPSVQQGILSITSPLPTVFTERPSRSNIFNQNHFHTSSGFSEQTPKRPKQIQIIIPYTTKNRQTPIEQQSPPQPSRFQNFDSSSGWSVQSYNTDQHDSQESKVITSTVTQPSVATKTTKILTKILASNLKELLHNEKSNVTSPNSIVDISRLQKNIDVWTEQEFSTPNKASTVSLSQSKAKIIPSEYLTTTPLPAKTEPISDIPSATTTPEPFLADQAYTKYDEQFDAQNNIIDSDDASSDLWTKLMLSISPSTKEKVYVVTPQPWRNIPSVDYTKRAGSGFKSPRFLVRPTPGPQSTSSAEVGFSFPESGKCKQCVVHVLFHVAS